MPGIIASKTFELVAQWEYSVVDAYIKDIWIGIGVLIWVVNLSLVANEVRNEYKSIA
jgi:hypothetical protein